MNAPARSTVRRRGTKAPSQPPETAPVRDRITELRRVKASELAPDPRNWRTHPEHQRAALTAMLTQIGYADALIARETPGGLMLLDGHLRQGLDPDQVLPVLVVDVDDDEAAMLMASLDPLAGMAIADVDALRSLLEELTLPDALEAELAKLLGGPRPGLADPDDIPARPRSSRVEMGEVWSLGSHRLMCADATSPDALATLMAGDLAAIMLTDPPYGVSYVGGTPRALRIAGDDAAGLPELLRASFACADAVLAPGAALYVFHPAGPLSVEFTRAFCSQGWSLRQGLVWVKDSLVLGRSDYHYLHEPILFGYTAGKGRRGRGGAGWFGGNAEVSVFDVPRPRSSPDHPTAKPVELLERMLANSSAPGAIVLDPFAGSGSTLMAAERLDRRARVVEIDPAYCEVVIARWEAFTGGKAVRLDA